MVDMKLSYNPDLALHPGESLRGELEFMDLSQVELAQRTGLSEKHISQIINGADPISPETSIKLERAIGVPASFWNNLQRDYGLNLARIESEQKLETEINEAKNFKCYAELVKLGCIEAATDWKVKAENLLKFFAVDSLLYIQKTEAVAFRQASGHFDEYSLAAWLRCGEIEAKKIEVQKFDKKKIKELIPEFRKLTTHPAGFGTKLKELCASAGIAVVYTPYLSNTKVNGSSRWVGDKPVIQLNTRGAYSDIFWFTFFHELGHILLHGVKERFVDYQKKEKDSKEKEADIFAANSLIPPSEYKDLLAIRPLNRLTVGSFARASGIHISIVLGRLAHEGKAKWNQIGNFRDKLIINPN
jgi:HTH-type transcriptional regulator/antitoxin HigA